MHSIHTDRRHVHLLPWRAGVFHKTVRWFLHWARSRGQADPQQLSKRSGALCSWGSLWGLLEEQKAATPQKVSKWILRTRWSRDISSPLWTECQDVETPRSARSRSHGPLRSDSAWGPLPASVRQLARLGAETRRTVPRPSHCCPTVVLAQIVSCYISFLHCRVEKCDEAWKTVLWAK